MDKQIDLYELLEVSPIASPAVIKAAYRCLSQVNHPDMHAGSNAASARQVRLNLAYATLSNPDSRLRYDQIRGIRLVPVERRSSPFTSVRRPVASNGASKPISVTAMRIYAFCPFD